MKNRKKAVIGALALALCVTLCGCAMTVEEMYCLPKRPERYDNLQTAMDPVMGGLDYAAPSTGENQQTVQTADLDGDGTEEVIVFARGGDEHPLKILVFRMEQERYALMNTIESTGTGFDQVEYAQWTVCRVLRWWSAVRSATRCWEMFRSTGFPRASRSR